MMLAGSLTTRSREDGAVVSPDGTPVLFLARTNDRFEKYYNGNIFLTPVGGGASQLVTETRDYDVTQARWSPDGQAVVFVANLGVLSELFQLTLADRSVDQLTEGRHSIRSWSIHEPSSRHVLTLKARGENPAVFDRRGILAGGVAPRSHTPNILRRRALSARRLTGLGAQRDFHHGLLVS